MQLVLRLHQFGSRQRNCEYGIGWSKMSGSAGLYRLEKIEEERDLLEPGRYLFFCDGEPDLQVRTFRPLSPGLLASHLRSILGPRVQPIEELSGPLDGSCEAAFPPDFREHISGG